ncbi:MAG: hypothetical protein M3R25_07005 [Bacteroidota bacterium]|nr:hypothetical protein [Bacteroidota bacterium]
MNAEVYSHINFKSSVKGCSDCWLINYSLWENHGTINPGDDTHKGTYNAIIGNDCPLQSIPLDPVQIPVDAKQLTNPENQKRIFIEQFELGKPIHKKSDHNRFGKKIKIKEIRNE